MSFLPEGYAPSQSGGGSYTKLQAGDTRLRVLAGQIVIGWGYWDNSNKPHRFPFNQKPTSTPDIKPGESLKELWILGVYNYETNAIEIWEVSQKTIIGALFNYAQHEDYGDPMNYGITVSKTGSGKEGTKYSVMAGVPKPLAPAIQKLADETPLNLQAMFSGGNPFDASPAPGAAPTKEQKKVLAAVDDNDLPF